MTKYKIYHINFFEKWDLISTTISQLRYNDNSMMGIKLTNISNFSIEGVYYEKIIYTETIDHPINGISTTHQETFIHTTFVIYKERGIVILLNPSRRSNSFFNFISINTTNLFSLSESQFNIYEFYKYAIKSLQEFRIKKIVFYPFNFLPQSTATISITSQNNALNDSYSLGINIPHNILKISFECIYQSKRLTGSLSSSGLVSVSSTADIDFLEHILDNNRLTETYLTNQYS
jgi:hypothetical protein